MESPLGSFQSNQSLRGSVPSSPSISPVPSKDTKSIIWSPVIKVLVGPPDNRVEFGVHQDLICPRSPFLTNALKGEWKESTEKTIVLPEDDPHIVAMYLHHLYFPTEGGPSPDVDDIDDKFTDYCALYVLVEKLMDAGTAGWVHDVLSQIGTHLSRRSSRVTQDGRHRVTVKPVWVPPLDAIQIIYDGTPERHAARGLLVELFADYGTRAHSRMLHDGSTGADIPKDFLLELTAKMLLDRPLPPSKSVRASSPPLRRDMSPDRPPVSLPIPLTSPSRVRQIPFRPIVWLPDSP